MSKSNKLQDICWQILLHIKPQQLQVHAQYVQDHMHMAMQIRFYIR